MSDERRKAALWSLIGASIAALGAAVIWGFGGVLLVVGVYVAAMSGTEFWVN